MVASIILELVSVIARLAKLDDPVPAFEYASIRIASVTDVPRINLTQSAPVPGYLVAIVANLSPIMLTIATLSASKCGGISNPQSSTAACCIAGVRLEIVSLVARVASSCVIASSALIGAGHANWQLSMLFA